MNTKQIHPVMKTIKNLLIACMISWIAVIILNMIGAVMIVADQIKQSQAGYISWISLLLSTIIGAWNIKKKSETKPWLWCLIFGFVYYLSLLCAGILLFEGQLTGGFVTLLITIGSSAAVIVTGNRRKKHSISRKKGYKTRAFV